MKKIAKDERLNEEAAMNNNLSSATLLMNDEIRKFHKGFTPNRRSNKKKS